MCVFSVWLWIQMSLYVAYMCLGIIMSPLSCIVYNLLFLVYQLQTNKYFTFTLNIQLVCTDYFILQNESEIIEQEFLLKFHYVFTILEGKFCIKFCYH